MSSYATKRKIRLIEAKYGPDWVGRFPGRSIDSIFIELTGDQRKNLFCKIDPDLKEKLDEMVSFRQLSMAELIEQIIDESYLRFMRDKHAVVDGIAAEYTDRS
jgi:hypothetical protein